MKHLKQKATGNLLKTSNEKAAELVSTGEFVYSTKGRFKSVLKEQRKQLTRAKRAPKAFGSKLVQKLQREQLKKRVSSKRNEQLQAERRNKKLKSRK